MGVEDRIPLLVERLCGLQGAAERAAAAIWRYDARMPKGRLRKARRRVVVVALARRDRRAARRMKGRA